MAAEPAGAIDGLAVAVVAALVVALLTAATAGRAATRGRLAALLGAE